MTEQELEHLRFPIGRFAKPENVTNENITDAIERITFFPARLKNEVLHLDPEQLDTPYRPEGWTIRQVVHHCADSHMNAIVRFKLTLTEQNPTIRPYQENLFAELDDAKIHAIGPSLSILEGVHVKLNHLLHSPEIRNENRYYVHPEYQTTYRLDQAAMLYAWHGDHHLAHITSLKARKGWK